MPFDGSEFAPKQVTAAPDRRRWLRDVATTLRRRVITAWAPAAPRPLHEPTAADLLRAARAVIADEQRWAQGRYSTLDGRHCAIGALRTVTRDVASRRAGKRAHAVLRGVALEAGFGSVEQMNDRWTHAEVIGAFDRAILAAERSSGRF